MAPWTSLLLRALNQCSLRRGLLMERERKGRGWREREEARQRRRARGGGGGEPAEGMQEEEAPKKKLRVWAPHVSEYWERSNRGILGHTKIRGSASGSKDIKDV